ncbi:ABC transporter ATP-binding protein [Anoxybacter fermentans]|nr:ABC transporter ATP-binding protein [Anoxybacter fermentans]
MERKKFSTFITFWRLIRIFGSSYKLVLIIVLTAILAGMEIIISYSLKKLLDSVLHLDYITYRGLILLLIGITILQMVGRFFRTRLAGDYAESGIARLRNILVEYLIHLPIGELEKRHSGDLISRMTNDLNQIREFSTQTMISIIYQPLIALGAFAFLLTLNWKLTLITSFGVPIIFKTSSKLSNPIARYTKELQEKLALVNKEAQDAINGMEIVRAYGLKQVLIKKYNQAVDLSIRSGIKVVKWRAILLAISLFTNFSPFLICFGFGGYWVIKGQMTAGGLIAFITLLNPLTFPISQLPTLLGELKGQMAAAGRVFEILDIEKEREVGKIYTIQKEKPVIVFKDVKFSYPDGKKVLDGVSFEIWPGEKVALVGFSGSGKSTIFKLILGFYEDFIGEIELFGHSIKDWNLKALRENISLVSQETYLFPGTIEDNISFGNEKADYEAIVAAAKAANAHDFITELKDGYMTDVGEFGDKLSGGQKQRISIARALLKRAPLLLLDEATSFLDSQSEYKVREALNNIMNAGITSFIISHRLSTIQKSDRILVLHRGRIVETGSHSELLEKNGIYKTLYLHQIIRGLELEEKEVVM